ncbi:MAG: hypothetical protein GVY30_04830 [Chloroflexi bacterium]|nr:hypothetical protein [Chloroflexota bacterium]
MRDVEIIESVDQIEEAAWLRAAACNPAFAFLDDSEEDVYKLTDGKPFDDNLG